MDNKCTTNFFHGQGKDRLGYQEHCGDGVIYYDCELLIDFGPFKEGHECNIYIDSSTSGDFTMYVGCDRWGHGGKLFVPRWTYLDSDDEENI